MNYAKPRQRETDKRWDYTNSRDHLCWPIGYCGGWMWPEPGKADFPGGFGSRESYETYHKTISQFREKYHRDGHATAEEAAECYRQYQLDNDLKFNTGKLQNEQQKCEAEGCDAWTQDISQITWMNMFPLCKDHQNRESVEKIFKVSTEVVIHS